MSEDNQISYEEVAAVAERLNKEGRKVTLEYVRRELGKGTHAQIAVCLGKWQKNNAHLLESNRSKYTPTGVRSDNAMGDSARGGALRRPDMSGFKSKKPSRNHTHEGYRQNEHRPRSRTQFIENSNLNESYQAIVPRESLTLARLQKEAPVIQKLFQALAIIKASRLQALEQYQNAQGELLSTRMECDKKVREFQKYANEQLLLLQTEFSRLKTISEHEIIAIRRQLSL